MALAVAIAAIAVAGFASRASPALGGSASARGEVSVAFEHLVGAPHGARELRPYVQDINGAMTRALAAGAANQGGAEIGSLLPDGAMHVTAVHRLNHAVASVAFTISDGGRNGYSWRFVGTAVRSAGRWKASWVTVCMLVEQEGVLCPNPPNGVSSPSPLPYVVADRQGASEQTPDLIRPGALALTAAGDLLIADSDRDQILERHPNGDLTIFAGTGRPGFSGDGGPAVDARLSAELGGMAMSPSGTLYFVDDDRVRAIAPNGTIATVAGTGRSGSSSGAGPALRARLNPSDVAVAANGTVYIANNSEILRLSRNGVLSIFAGGSGRSGDVATPGGPMAFSPTDMAFDGAGNLDVFSFSPKEIFQIAPSGAIRLLGGAYTAQLATAPDGDVLSAGHGENIGRVTPAGAVGTYLDLLKLKINGLWSPGDLPGLEPSGIAVTGSGVIYLDSSEGNGYSGGTALVRVTTARTLQALPIRTPVLDTLPAPGSPSFPASVYPNPSPARGADLSSCPSLEGIERFNRHSTASARTLAEKFNAFTSSFYGDLRSSDRAWWSSLFGEWVGYGYDRDNHRVLTVQPAGRDTFAAAVARACGRRLVRDSVVVDVGPSPYSFQVSHLYLLDRRGHPLVYFQAT